MSGSGCPATELSRRLICFHESVNLPACLLVYLSTHSPNALPIYTMILIFNTVQVLQIRAHLTGGLRHLCHFNVFKLIEVKDGPAHFVIQQRVASLALMLGQNAHAIAGDGFGALHFEQYIDQSKWEEVTFGALERGRHIRKGKQEPDDLLAVQDDFDEARARNQKKIIHR